MITTITNIDSTFVMPIASIKSSLPIEQYNIIVELFPNGIPCDVSSIKTLLDNGLTLEDVNEMKLPWTGVIENYKSYKLISCKDGVMHSFDDKPSVIMENSDQYWYKDGNLHRDNGPAAIFSNGTQYWWIDGKLHNDIGPAIIYSNGTQRWFKNGRKINPPT